MAFDSCTSLKSLTIPSTVSEVEDSFYEETQLIFKNASFQQRENGTYVNGISVNVTAKERYDYAFQVLELVNAERAKLKNKTYYVKVRAYKKIPKARKYMVHTVQLAKSKLKNKESYGKSCIFQKTDKMRKKTDE